MVAHLSLSSWKSSNSSFHSYKFLYPIICADAFVDRDKDSESGVPSIPPSSILSIDLELVSFKPVINVTGDLGVLKKILKEGEGTLTADEGAAVTSKYLELCACYLLAVGEINTDSWYYVT